MPALKQTLTDEEIWSIVNSSSFSRAINAEAMLQGLAATNPSRLACMHGSAWRGDGVELLLLLTERFVHRRGG